MKYTDVDGIMPIQEWFPMPVLQHISYNEVFQMADQGRRLSIRKLSRLQEFQYSDYNKNTNGNVRTIISSYSDKGYTQVVWQPERVVTGIAHILTER